jgi:hypothetical protein
LAGNYRESGELVKVVLSPGLGGVMCPDGRDHDRGHQVAYGVFWAGRMPTGQLTPVLWSGQYPLGTL